MKGLLPVLACLAMGASVANASIELKFLKVGPASGSGAVPLSYNGQSVTVNVGQLVWDGRNDSGAPSLPLADYGDADANLDNLISFCIELSQSVSGSWNTYEKATLADAVDPGLAGATSYKLGAQRASVLDLLADNYWDDATGTNLLNAVSFQLAIWEIVHELSQVVVADPLNPPLAPVLDITQGNGSFYVDGAPTSGLLHDAIDQANDWLSLLPTLTSDDSLSVIALTNPNRQDQIVQYASPTPPSTATTPEPTSLLAWCGLFGASLMAARRRR